MTFNKIDWEPPAMRQLTAVEDQVCLERLRQKKKWALAHDDEHKDESLAAVASSLAHPLTHFVERCGCREAMCPHTGFRKEWTPPAPEWAGDLYLKNDRRRRLIIAAALLIAEVERMDRQEARDASTTALMKADQQATTEVNAMSDDHADLLSIFNDLESVCSLCLDDETDANRVEEFLAFRLGFIPSDATTLVRQHESLDLIDDIDRMTFARAILRLKKLNSFRSK